MLVPRVTSAPRGSVAVGVAAARAAAILALFVYATQPGIRKPELFETATWGILVIFAFAGFGALLNLLVLPRRRADFGLRAMWGASVLAALGGALAATSLFSRTAAVVSIDLGLVAYCAVAIKERRHGLRSLCFVGRVIRRNGLLTALVGVVFIATAVHYLGAVADPTSNPYDDDVAYFPLVRKLLDTGTLIEPFSFRRLSALGGQLYYLALVVPHATYRHLNTFDRGICIVLFVALVLGHRHRGRRVPLVVSTLLVGFFLTLPNTSINTAAHFSGFAFFVALFRTLSFVREDDSLLGKAIPVAIVSAATCTLRQNYLSVPVVMLGLAYVYRLGAARRQGAVDYKALLREPAVVAGVTLLALVPWLVLAYRSNDTFLFPMQVGTYRKAMDLQSPTVTFPQEIRFLFSVALENEPIRGLGVIALAGAMVKDEHPYRPLRTLWIACAFSLVFLSHAFTLSDTGNLGRYLFGPFAGLATAVVLTIGTTRLDRLHGVRNRAALGLAVVAMLAQFTYSREKSVKFFQTAMRNVDMQRRQSPRSLETMPHEAFMYPHLQSFVPAGETMAVMADDPYYFDFSRNRILNLDMPGFSSPRPGMPYFQGSEKVADYFAAQGIRYLVFVRPEFSHWLYQREFWFARMFNEEEIWRVTAPYFVDQIDSFTALAKTRKKLHEEAGIVVLDLGTREDAR